MSNVLFQPIQIGNLTLPHRIAMAPLTRSRASKPGNAPTELNETYYAQRASASLIITEASQISQQGQGYAWTPGIYTEDQIQGWKKIAKTVHANNGSIFLQLWHVGRVSHPSFQPNHTLPIGPTAMEVPGKTFIEGEKNLGEWSDVPVPREATSEDIQQIIADYRQAAINAIEAGMDGVEIHAGNGYLLDQFINSNSNKRNDSYGGNIINRARLLLEVTQTIVQAIGADKVAVRLTPMGRFMGMGDDTPKETFGYIVEELNKFKLAYLHLVEPQIVGTVKDEEYNPEWDSIILMLRDSWKGILILAGGYTKETAIKAIESGRADIIAFGRPFIANPDLPTRFKLNLELNQPQPESFFGGNEQGYIDYPFHS